MRFKTWLDVTAGAMACAVVVPAVRADVPGPLDPPFTSTLNLGFNDLAVGQPTVFATVKDPGTGTSLGPVASQPFLLDTGATGIYVAGGTFYDPQDISDFLNNVTDTIVPTNAAAELLDAGLVIEGAVGELGVGGVSEVDVSAPYHVEVYANNQLQNTISNAKMLVNEAADFGSFAGIVGMPAMVGKVTTLDMSVWSGGLGDYSFDLSNIDEFLDNLEQLGSDGNMKVTIGNALPAASDPAKRLSIPVTYKTFDYTNELGLPDFTVPENAPLPFTSATFKNANNTPVLSNDVLIDTGAQISIIDSDIAIQLGLDRNHDNVVDELDLDPNDLNEQLITVSGVSGTADAPVMRIDGLEIVTDEGVTLSWTPYLLILDIDDEIPAIFGADLITSGWTAVLLAPFADLLGLPPGPAPTDGNFQAVHFDFTNGSLGHMYFDLTGAVPEPGVLLLIGLGGALLLPRRRRHHH